MIASLPAAADLGTLRGATRQESAGEGRSLAKYARSWGLAAEHLAWANGLSPEASTGAKVKLPARILPANPPQDGAVVNLAERGMYLFRGGEYQGFFPLAIGRGDKASYRTPTGTFKIVDRQKNPTWIAPDSGWAKALKKEKIKGGDKDNPLGEYWFGFDHPEGGYGFHENEAPATTGDKVSHGCLRLYPEHAKKIFDQKLLIPGDTVRIEHQPVVLGKSKSGEVFVSVFPAAYGKVDLQANLAQELDKEGLTDLVPQAQLKTLASATGLPQRVLGKPIGLIVDGKPAEVETPALKRAGQVIVPTALARELGCQVKYDPKLGITVSKDGKTETFALGGKAKDGEPRAFRWGDTTMVPVRALLQSLDISFVWDAKDAQLEIES